MPKQSLLRFIKRWKRYELRENFRQVPKSTRTFMYFIAMILPTNTKVVYIGVAGLGVTGGGGVRPRLRRHDRRIKNWTHYSIFEVHDNVTREEIRELEALLLGIFRHDPRIQLTN
ncbi:MAG: hypothetical protein Q7R45_12525, partial [Sulfuricaulis sp.]|nr:hypothetical protein [Sulfuricaulis sp.]